jgi:hypothetical protein
MNEKWSAIIASVKTPTGLCALFGLLACFATISIGSFAKVPDASRPGLIFTGLIILALFGISFTFWVIRASAPSRDSRVQNSGKISVCAENSNQVEALLDGDREGDYKRLRDKAKHRIGILGVGMTSLTKHELDSLKKQVEHVNIDILMMCPNYLKSKPEFTQEIETLFGKENLASKAEKSFGLLKELCETWNKNPDNGNKFRFRVYRHLPNASMVVIDWEKISTESELIVEMFLYQRGARPRFKLIPSAGLFDCFKEEFKCIWDKATPVVPS